LICNHLILKEIIASLRVAWRLLSLRLVVAHTMTYAVIIYGVGCIIPTPLEQQSQPLNYPPNIVAAATTPQFGPLDFQHADPVGFNIVADDPNLDDELRARLFTRASGLGPRAWNGLEIKLLFPSVLDPQHPFRRAYSFPTIALCSQLDSRSQGGLFDVYVVVADRQFKPSPDDDQSDGFTAENHWEVTCHPGT
jgi:hypothetical protein